MLSCHPFQIVTSFKAKGSSVNGVTGKGSNDFVTAVIKARILLKSVMQSNIVSQNLWTTPHRGLSDNNFIIEKCIYSELCNVHSSRMRSPRFNF